MKKVLFCGTTNLDYFIYSKSLPTEGVTIKGNFEQNAGGKGANQAVACSKLGNKPFFPIWCLIALIIIGFFKNLKPLSALTLIDPTLVNLFLEIVPVKTFLIISNLPLVPTFVFVLIL